MPTVVHTTELKVDKERMIYIIILFFGQTKIM
jgi:hypothetical protein